MAESFAIPEPKETRTCPACCGCMSFVGALPKLGGLPELRTFRCADCGATESFEEKLASGDSDETDAVHSGAAR